MREFRLVIVTTVSRRLALMLLTAGGCALAAASPGTPLPQRSAPPKLTAEEIVARNVAARGGLQAWRKVQTMVWIGRLESRSSAQALVPFVLQMKRPDKTRFEVTVGNTKSVRAFDGREGWQVRPLPGGRGKLTPYTAEEVRFAKDAPGIDGPLIDHEAKGIDVRLDGADNVAGHPAYRLAVRLPSGTTRRLWVDADTFLDTKYERETHGPGRPGAVFIFYRDYRTIDGLQIPMAIETTAADGRPGDRMVIDRVLVNPALPDGEFGSSGGLTR